MDNESQEMFFEKMDSIIKSVIPIEESEFIAFIKSTFAPIMMADMDDPNHSPIQTKIEVIQMYKSIPEKYPQFGSEKYVNYMILFQKVAIAIFLNDESIDDNIKKETITSLTGKDFEYIYPELKTSQLHKENVEYANSFMKEENNKEEIKNEKPIIQETHNNYHNYNNSQVTHGDNSSIRKGKFNSVTSNEKEKSIVTFIINNIWYIISGVGIILIAAWIQHKYNIV